MIGWESFPIWKLGGGSGPPTGKYENFETPEREGLPGLIKTEKGVLPPPSLSSLLRPEFMLVTTQVVSQTSMVRSKEEFFDATADDVHDRIFWGNLLGLYQAVDIFVQ